MPEPTPTTRLRIVSYTWRGQRPLVYLEQFANDRWVAVRSGTAADLEKWAEQHYEHYRLTHEARPQPD